MYEGMPTTRTGNFNMTMITISTAFESHKLEDGYRSASFDRFMSNLDVISRRVQTRYDGTFYPVGTGSQFEGKPYDPANGQVNPYSADVMIPAFLSAYSGKDAEKISLDLLPSLASILPNWNVTYSGLSKLSFMKKLFRSFDINHGYKSVYTVGSYNSFSSFMSYMGDLGFIKDVTTGNPIPSSPYDISTVSINESFAPLMGVSMTFLNGITGKLEYKRTRVLTLSVSSLQIVEAISKDFVIGTGYKIIDFQPFAPKMRGRNAKKDASASSSKGNASGTISHDLNLRLDLSLRNQSTLNRNITTGVTQPTSGNKAWKWSLSADYQLSRQLTLKLYYDYQRNIPLISSAAYPVTNADFGASVKFNLTR